ncbi:MAG: calcium-binding protein [Actinomycetota bacterium]
MKKFTSTAVAAAQDPRSVARFILALVASVLVVLLGLMAMSSGPNGALVFAQATATPTESPSPTGPSIKLLNPSPAYNPGLEPTGELPDDPKISDKFDGVDTAYHVVALVSQAPPNAVVEASWQPAVGLEQTVGLLQRHPEAPEIWEFYWDIPDTMSEGSGEFIVRLYQQGVAGAEEVASDSSPAELRHRGTYGAGDPQPAEETVEITWPAQSGQLGFHRPKGGSWKAVVEGLGSGPETVGNRLAGGVQRVYVFYSTAGPGDAPAFTACGNVNPGGARPDGSVPWSLSCTLGGKTAPSEVTAIAAVAAEVDQAARTGLLTQESADVHLTDGYVQDVSRMTLDLYGVRSGESAAYPSGERRQAAQGCLIFEVLVKDHLGRPVQGANVDVHMQGPNDQAGFGADGLNSSSSEDSAKKNPDKGEHATEPSRYCYDDIDTPSDDRGSDAFAETIGEHNVPGGADIKHIESVAGTGLDSTANAQTAYRYGPGVFRFSIFSFNPGFTDLTAWIDDAPLANEADTREADDDLLGTGEISDTVRAQWLSAPMSISIAPRADSAPVGECNRFTVRARAGNAVVPNFNVDIHASGPNNDLDFCDPTDATTRRAPDSPSGSAAHRAEDEGEASHPSSSPDQPEVQHTEGETDADGNFVFGITSTATGSTQITAWGDGEPGRDNDVQGSSEPSGTASKRWAATAADAEVRIVNPSAYGGAGTQVSKKRDADERYHLVARVDLPDVIPGVEFFIQPSGGAFTKIGDALRVADSDTWELSWDVNVPDGAYTLRAQIIGTEKREDRSITVRNNASATDPRVVPFETAELTRPLNAGAAPFDNGATTLEGVASAGAKGVEFYYTTAPAPQSLASADWIRCGGVTLSGGSAPQNFQGPCAIPSTRSDVALDVTGIAVLAYICESTGCTTQQNQEIGRIRHSGDAHRVFGFEANPNIFIEPSEASDQAGTCKRFEARVVDRAGRAIPNANVDIHLTGPGETVSFCELEGGSQRRSPDRGGHSASPTSQNEGFHPQDGDDTVHTEGETNEGGRFIFGIQAADPGDSNILAWVDQDDNDEQGSGEKSASALMHWTKGAGGGPKDCTVTGDSGDNVLRGTPGDDVICGLGGHDTLIGRGGHDLLRAGPGRDIVRGGGGRDLLRGGSGPDRLRGDGGNDRLYGNTGNDFLNGGTGRDACRGGRGRDRSKDCER